MHEKSQHLRAIDLYSGIGGWSLGLHLAGIEVVASYERWGAANETNFKNNHHQANTVDIRLLDLADLPTGINLVVGSPPCTQFSYSNRGGSGDVEDGMADIIRFLEIVDHLRPTFWVMENVPRVVKIISNELKPGGVLHRFAHLKMLAHIINMAEFGLPQRRKRGIIGNLDFGLLHSYRDQQTELRLGDIVAALCNDPVVDPLYGTTIAPSMLRDQKFEAPLNVEEDRINRAGKTLHPVYNRMPYPDALDRSARTITATCTRVSRESVVIEDRDNPGKMRRLSLRERASLQGFPITYQFYAFSHGQKLRMIGNAVPPPFAYLIGHTARGTPPAKVPRLNSHAKKLVLPKCLATEVKVDSAGASYREDRKFRFAIPSLRLASGVRFELANLFVDETTRWAVAFVFGTSKQIYQLELNEALYSRLMDGVPRCIKADLQGVLDQLARYILQADIRRMQSVWNHSGPGATRPFMLLDELDHRGSDLTSILAEQAGYTGAEIAAALAAQYGEHATTLAGTAKLTRHAPLILAGLFVGARANIELSKAFRHPILNQSKPRKLAL